MPEDLTKGVSTVGSWVTRSKLAARSKETNPEEYSNKSPPHTALAGLEQEEQEEEEVMKEAEVDIEEGAAQLHMEKIPHLNNNNNNNNK